MPSEATAHMALAAAAVAICSLRDCSLLFWTPAETDHTAGTEATTGAATAAATGAHTARRHVATV
jgi:hypothetical protein